MADHIFSSIAASCAAENDEQYLLMVSYLEIYNEKVYDLLSDSTSSLEVRETKKGGFQVPNLSKHIVTEKPDLLKLITQGNERRYVGANMQNEKSSRSHSMLSLYIEKSTKGKVEGKETKLTASKLHLVDLAGSERYSSSSSELTRKETVNINKSLSCLANVISALTSRKTSHVPYRDSKLTRLLKDSLGGNTKTRIITCISPAQMNVTETLSSLRYASRAKKIENRPHVNENPQDAVMKSLYQEIAKLKSSLKAQSHVGEQMFKSLHQLPFFDKNRGALSSPKFKHTAKHESVRKRMQLLTSCLVQKQKEAGAEPMTLEEQAELTEEKMSDEDSELLAQFQDDITQLYQAYVVADSRFKAAQTEVTTWRTTKAKHEQWMTTQRAKLEQEKVAWKQEKESSRTTWSSKSSIERWELEKHGLQTRLADLEAQVVTLTREKESLQAEVEACRDEISTLEHSLQKQNNSNDAVNTNHMLEHLLTENERLRRRNECLDTMDDQLEAVEQQLLHLTSSALTTPTSFEGLFAQVASIRNEISRPTTALSVFCDPQDNSFAVSAPESKSLIKDLGIGDVFTKYDVARSVRSSQPRITATVRNIVITHPEHRLYWTGIGEELTSTRSIPLAEIKGFCVGKQGRSFSCIQSAVPERCFTIISHSRALALEAKTRVARDIFLNKLIRFMQFIGKTDLKVRLDAESCVAGVSARLHTYSRTRSPCTFSSHTFLDVKKQDSKPLKYKNQLASTKLEQLPEENMSSVGAASQGFQSLQSNHASLLQSAIASQFSGLDSHNNYPVRYGQIYAAPNNGNMHLPVQGTGLLPGGSSVTGTSEPAYYNQPHPHPLLKDALVVEIAVRARNCFRVAQAAEDTEWPVDPTGASFLVGLFENRRDMPSWTFVEHTEKITGTRDPSFHQKFVMTYIPSWRQQILLSLYDMEGTKARERNRIGSACIDLATISQAPNKPRSIALVHASDSLVNQCLQKFHTQVVVECTRSRFLQEGEEPPGFDSMAALPAEYQPAHQDASAGNMQFASTYAENNQAEDSNGSDDIQLIAVYDDRNPQSSRTGATTDAATSPDWKDAPHTITVHVDQGNGTANGKGSTSALVPVSLHKLSPSVAEAGKVQTNSTSVSSTSKGQEKPIEDVLATMRRGCVMTKFANRNGKPELKLVFLDENDSMLYWCKIGHSKRKDKSKSVVCRDVTDLVVGSTNPKAAPFLKKGAIARGPKDEYCFAIVTKKRVLALECMNTEERDMWVRGLQSVFR